jgi:hypothetical protein
MRIDVLIGAALIAGAILFTNHYGFHTYPNDFNSAVLFNRWTGEAWVCDAPHSYNLAAPTGIQLQCKAKSN